MKRLILKQILLLSFMEKKARRITFDRSLTVIQGDNDTGKSSLIKSIYWTFGAEVGLHPKWEALNVVSVVQFDIDGLEYRILHRSGIYAVFDSDGVMTVFNRVVDLAGFLGHLLDFKMIFLDRQNNPITPPPAYFLLPFYVDQDRSWGKNWNAFKQLEQLSNWKTSVIEYHTGIRPNEFYEVNNEKRLFDIEIADDKSEVRVMEKVHQRLTAQYRATPTSVSVEDFALEIDDLVKDFDGLKEKEDVLKNKMLTLSNQRVNISLQKTVVEKSLDNAREDFEYASQAPDEIECPTCGTIHNNTFVERLSIAMDEDRCYDLLSEYENSMHKIEDAIKTVQTEFNENDVELKRITELLEKKRSEVKFKDFIKAEGTREMRSLLNEDIENLQQSIGKKLASLEGLKTRLRKFNDKKRKKEIQDRYFDNMQTFLYELNVHTLREQDYKSMFSNIDENGSDKPRALLAYYYSLLDVIHAYSQAAFCPIIIDSPNQQEQDSDNLNRIMKFILERRPAETQLILGLVELGDVDITEGKIIALNKKYGLLQEEEYLDVSNEIKPLLDRGLNLK